MITNSVGTILYSFLFGKMIGKDKIGNKFFIHRKIKGKKWVLYKKNIDPTALEVKWQIWLTNTDMNSVNISEEKNYAWQKTKKANLTGTINSYHPSTSIENGIDNIKKNIKNSIWKPD